MERQELQRQEQTVPRGPERTRRRRTFRPPVDIVESERAIVLHVDLPGVDEQHVNVSLDRNVLTIEGSVSWQEPETHELVYREYAVGDYVRSFTLSDEIDRDKIEAVMKNGVLKLTLPKAEPPEAKKITVRAG